jgi:hypothetical protein
VRKVFTAFSSSAEIDFHPGLDPFQFSLVLMVIVALLVLEFVGRRKHKPVWKIVDEQSRWLRWSAYYAFGVAFIVLLLLNPEHKAQPFIYFQF